MLLTTFRAGVSAMVARIVRELGIPKSIDSLVAWDPKQCKHSPGTYVLAMTVNILIGRTTLYRVEEVHENLDVPVLFGLDASASDSKDSALARTLDKIFEAGPKRVFRAAARQAMIRRGRQRGRWHVRSLICFIPSLRS